MHPLSAACFQGRLEDVRSLFQTRQFSSSQILYAFRCACRAQAWEVVEWMIGQAAAASMAPQSPHGCRCLSVSKLFRWACKLGSVEMIHRLFPQTPPAEHDLGFRLACQRGHLAAAQCLEILMQPLSPSYRRALDWACNGDHVEVVRWLASCIWKRTRFVPTARQFRRWCQYGRMKVAAWAAERWPAVFYVVDMATAHDFDVVARPGTRYEWGLVRSIEGERFLRNCARRHFMRVVHPELVSVVSERERYRNVV